MTRTDVVVVGGGVNGTSTAYHLAQLGITNVTLVERGPLASGATGKSGALVRMHYTNPYESKLAYESLKIFRNWRDLVGGNCGWQNPGFVQVAPPGYEEALVSNVRDQQEIGINTTVIPKEDLKQLVPEINVDDIGAAAYEPDSGWADPNATTFAFARAASQLGADIRTHCEVTSIVTDADRVVAVQTTEGRIDTDTVVVAPGVAADGLLKPLGLDYGLYPYRSPVAIFRWPEGFNGPHPVVIDATTGSWIRPEGTASTLIGTESGAHRGSPDSFDETISSGFVAIARQHLTARFPAFRHATMRGGWAGMFTMSPDGRPIIDQIPSIRGLYCMLGDSGSSFKTAPAIGKCLAEWIVHGEPQTADLTPFRSTRFAEGNAWSDERKYGEGRQTISR